MQIKMTSVFVDDQAKALKFYTEVLEFIKKFEVPVGEFLWLTVVSPEAPDEIELVLEPNNHPAAKAYQAALKTDGIPCLSLAVKDIDAEYKRMQGLGVEFRSPPTDMGPTRAAIFDDTCGNWIQMYQS
ncbi:VOC family protein [Herpetosiphon giganteus]|uniref:VOC family protein n=1 Tax=Herpetosiphon giganteus TaxID=2029754 RepID=UPI00195B2B2B|nr:VOC family protein [Herpetosiphon giganteus]MBM7846191.1 putative enzyme related to lactoylglutathione lyase [Herpetosiphon giganteus]